MLSSNADTLKKDDTYINNEINVAEILSDACVTTLAKTTQRVLNQQSSDSFFFFFSRTVLFIQMGNFEIAQPSSF